MVNMKQPEVDVRQWFEKVVLGLNLCPFAKRPYDHQQIKFFVSNATKTDLLLDDIHQEIQSLEDDAAIETTLVIAPFLLERFEEYNDFLDWVDFLLVKSGWEGVFQIASFHPDYYFADTMPADPENLTNRAPHPVFHILRESSLEKAIASYPDVDAIPDRNMALMRQLTDEQKLELFPYLFKL